MLTVVHFNVAARVLISFIEDDNIPCLWNIGVGWHCLRSVPHQEGSVISRITGLRTIRCVKARRLHPQPTIHRTVMTGPRERVRIHPIRKLTLVQVSA